MRPRHEEFVEDRLRDITNTLKSILEIMNEESNTGTPEEQLDCWAIVELFGHNKIAGKIKTVSLAGGAMLRVDVPPVAEQKGYTRFFGNKAIYAINPVEEQIATAMAGQCRSELVQQYQLPRMLSAGEPPAKPYDDDPYENPNED